MKNRQIENNSLEENVIPESEMMKIRREKFFSLKNSGKNCPVFPVHHGSSERSPVPQGS